MPPDTEYLLPECRVCPDGRTCYWLDNSCAITECFLGYCDQALTGSDLPTTTGAYFVWWQKEKDKQML